MEDTQACARCKQDLSIDEFSPSRRGRNGVWCRACHSGYNRERNQSRARKPDSTCSVCAKAMFSVLPPEQAVCLACRRERARRRKQARRSHPRKRVCPMCRRTFEHDRRTYCGNFCKLMGSRVGVYRGFMRMEGQYRQARWWVRLGEPSYIIGPPRFLLDLWVTPNGEVRCSDCADVMNDLGPMGHECEWCGIRAILV